MAGPDFPEASGSQNEKGRGAIFVAILRGSGSTWSVVGPDAGQENRKKEDVEEISRPQLEELTRLSRDYPDAPVPVLGLLDYP